MKSIITLFGIAAFALVGWAGKCEACNQVVRRGGVEGRPYWNGHAIMFMYPPAFDFKTIDGAVDYRFEIADDAHVKHVFKAKEPTADLVPVWTKLPTGYVTVDVYGEDGSGRTLGLSGTRTFWKKATFKEGAYPKAKYGYDECAGMIYGYQFRSADYQYTLKTGKLAQSFDNRYPAKMMGGLINGMVNYAELCPEKRDEALRLARQAVKALVALSEKPDAKYPSLPPTYNPEKYPANHEWWPSRRKCMTIYPVLAANAYLRLYGAVKEPEYLELARHVADTYLAFQGEDGTWPLMIHFDEGPIGKNRMIPIETASFLESLYEVTGDVRYRAAGDRAFAYVEKKLIANWNWEGQFEDTPPTEKYRNLTKHPACSTAIYLLQRYPGDKEKVALARELLRFAEDLFVNWEKPFDNGRRVPDPKTFTGYYNHFWKQDKWIMPSVFEQYGCYTPVDASAAKLIRTYLAFYRVERNPTDLAKAKALGDTATRCTSPDGLEATWWTEDELRSGVWPNCMLATATALHELAQADAAPLEVTCRIVRTDGTRDVRVLPLARTGDTAVLRLKAADVGEAKTVELEPSFATAATGDAGYFVTPENTFGRFHETNGVVVVGEGRNYMPVYGMKTPRATFVAIARRMCWRYQTVVEAKKGSYRMFQRYCLNGDRPYEDFEIAYVFLPESAGYPQMAKVYRDWQLGRGACRPIRERMKEQPELALAATNVEVRIRQAWKPVPSPVEIQTPFNEPKVHAAVTFDRCGDIVREFRRQGVDHAEICLVGWNKGGHDGAYPQLFPVEPTLGGEAKLREFVKLSNGLGFQTVCHTCFYSAYAIADDFDEEYLLKEKDGSLQPSHTNWGGGKPFRTCPQRAYEKWVKKSMQMVKDLGFHGLHYHDVYSILPPRICYDPRHPCDPNQSIYWYNRQMVDTKKAIGGAQSEGPFDSYVGNLDFAMYVNFYPLEDDFAKKPMIDGLVPFWQLVYHGIVLANPFTGSLNYPVKAPHKRLKFVEFGGRPLFVWYANFLTGKSNWMGKEDLVCATDEELRAGVAAIKRAYDEYEKLSDLQFEFMEDHRVLASNVTLTAYSNGSRVVVNHGSTPYVFENTTVPPGDWRRFDKR